MNYLKKYIVHFSIITALLAGAWFLFGVHATAGDAKKIAEDNAATQKLLSSIVISNDAKLEVFLQLSGFDRQVAREWSEIPRVPKMDTIINGPMVNHEWLKVSDDMGTGVLLKVVGYTIEDGDTCVVMVVDTLWQVMNK